MTSDNDNNLLSQRRAKLEKLREQGNAFPNTFKRSELAANLYELYEEFDKESLASKSISVKVAGRMMTRRMMGKASFAHIHDMSGQIQLYIRQDELPDGVYVKFKHWDIGDIIGAEGKMFKTNKGELSIEVENLHLLTKSLRPLPEKFHGLTDHETRHRQRYLDLIFNEDVRNTFAIRSQVIDFIRDYLKEDEYIEVETPMMHPIPGGATARPFVTFHNSMDMELYLRIAPELYLKRLIVGGLERVFEINRSFRNEGLSPRHNSEFTMLEFYQAYADYNDLIDKTEDMIRKLVHQLTGTYIVEYQGEQYDFSDTFKRMSLVESILNYNEAINRSDLESLESIRSLADRLEISHKDHYGQGRLQLEIFEKTVEAKLKGPCLITGFPTEVSPLARRSDSDPLVADRFEFFIGGKEIANGFSELNDPEDQAERFRQQVKDKEAGDEEAMHYDSDYITALEYGMPPTAGEGIGIDRLVMLLTDSSSIRDVILFPYMRPKD